MPADLRDLVQAYLRDHRTMTLATHDGEGPWAATVFYVNDGPRFYWLSKPTARHSKAIAVDPRVAATIQEDYPIGVPVQGVQMAGTAVELGRVESVKPGLLYAAKFPYLSVDQPGELAALLAVSRMYRFTPSRVYFIDNNKGIGHRDEIDLECWT
jgi:hypothetical protein